jgi:metal-sulfur cluster biosynthetic enzyme
LKMSQPFIDPAMKDKSAAPVLPDRDAILAGLRGVIDPEVGMNIVDLGLVYRVDIGATAVTIDMTMTSPACPMGDMMVDAVKAVLDALVPPGTRTEVNLVWSPPWDPSRMSETAKKHFSW